MGAYATPIAKAALRPSGTRTHDRRPDRRTEIEDLRMEVAALCQERSWLGTELARLSQLFLRSVLHQSDEMAMEASGRLDYLAGRLNARGTGA